MRSVLVLIMLTSSAAAAPPVVCHKQQTVIKTLSVPAAVEATLQSVLVQHALVPTFYTPYAAAAAQYNQTQSIDGAEQLELLRQIRDLLQSGAGGATRVQAVDPLKLVHATCLKCHNQANAKGGFRVDVELSKEDRLRAIEMMMLDDNSRKMPKGRNLDPATLGRVLQELSKQPSNDPPPPPAREAEQVQ